eukprot:1151454-Pelagomonas_calceolata.AAC.1
MDFDQPGQEAEGPGEESGEVIADIGRQSPSAIGASLTAEERGRLILGINSMNIPRVGSQTCYRNMNDPQSQVLQPGASSSPPGYH